MANWRLSVSFAIFRRLVLKSSCYVNFVRDKFEVTRKSHSDCHLLGSDVTPLLEWIVSKSQTALVS